MRIKKSTIIKIAVLCLLIAGVIWYFENFKLENLIIEGGTHYTSEEIEEMLVKSDFDRYTHAFYFKYAVFSSPDPIPFVEKLDIEIVDKNTIHIQVYDKILTGCVEHMGRYMHFDREGIVVESAMEPDKGVPVITGLPFTKVVLGQKLEIEDDVLFERIQELTLQLKEYGIECQRINFDIRRNITLYIGGSEAQLGNDKVFDYKISALKKVLEASGGVDYIYDLKNYTPETGEITGKIKKNVE
ncbi:MAG: hypothetical protein IK007_04830 [Lachnospiraceae bacterium]|nr:hypothetical protein [Lachnospiraceae bacterium]